jgi:hypothetical protein
MVVGCILAGFSLGYIPGLIACTILIGVCTGFYLVPLFTLLQFRAPKASKGDMVASSNLINVTGAIAASLLFAALVWAAEATEFLPSVPETDAVAIGRLERELVRGRPVYLRVGDFEVGRRPSPGRQRLNVWDHLFGARPGPVPPEIEIDRDVNSGDEVIVSHYRIAAVDHYVVRPTGKPLETHHDARHLPRFLFLGAGVMTLGVLLVLWHRVRDLPARALALVRSAVGPRFVPDGLVRVPGDGPVILLIETTDPAALRAICSAVDRYVEVIEPKSAGEEHLTAARAVLARGDVVGVRTVAPAAAEFAAALNGLHVPVRLSGNHLVFGEGTVRLPE